MKTSPITKQIQFTASSFEMGIIAQIANRARGMRPDYPYLTALMDLEACHCNGNPLDLNALLAAGDFDFAHDVFGIARHIDRRTGELKDFFVPRFSQR